MSTYKRGQIYFFNFWWNGRHIQRSTRQGNPKIARNIESAYRTALAKGEVGIVERKRVPTLKDATADFLSWSEQQHATHPRTHTRYVTSSRALLRFFGNRLLDQITTEDVERFKTKRAAEFKLPRPKPTTQRSRKVKRVAPKRIRPATVNRELACLKAVFNHAIKADLVVKNPVKNVRFLPEDNEQTRVLTYAEQQRYLAAAPQPLHDIASLMLETGMRPEEVYRIKRENVQVEAGYLFNPHGKTKAAKRKVHLTARATAILTTRLRDAVGSYLFPLDGDPTKPLPKINHAHDRAVRKSGVAPFRLYDLRHTWATRAAESGIDLVTLAAMLGHSRIQQVLRYAHPTEEHQAKAASRFERFVAEQQGQAEGLIQ